MNNDVIQVFCPKIREESIEAASKVLRSNWIGQGPQAKQFEQDFQVYLQTINKCVATMSATDSLEIALYLLNLPTQSEVITTPITFISSNHVILHANLKPVFADVNPLTGCICPKSIREKITSNTRALMIVHLSGQTADMEEIEKIATEHNLKIIEDSAHAAGSYYHNGLNKGKRVGNSNNIISFSFQAVKNCPCGDGSMLVLPTEELYQKALKFRWLGISKDTFGRTSKTGEYLWKYDVPYLGIKSNINDILCAIGIEQLKYLDSDNERRREIARFYKQQLSGIAGVQLPDINIEYSSCHFYPILVDRRDDLMTHMRNNQIFCGMHYQRNDKYANYVETELPGAEYFELREITLPLHLHLTNDDLQRIIDTIKMGW